MVDAQLSADGKLFAVLRQAAQSLVWLKFSGVSLFVAIFFSGYFYLLNHPASQPIVVPLTLIDQMIPMSFWAWIPYLSLWFYTALPPLLHTRLRLLCYYGLTIGLVCSFGLLCFYFYPTTTPSMFKPDAENLSWLQGVDAASNACPSLHVATAVFSSLWLGRMFSAKPFQRLRNLNWIWCALIVYSTLATKQHVFLDALAGLVLGASGAWLSLAGLKLGFVRRWLYNEKFATHCLH